MSAGSHCLAYCLHGAAYDDVEIYVMINAGPTDVTFGIHEQAVGSWRRAIDTALPESPQDILEPGQEVAVSSAYYPVQARSVVVLLDGKNPAPRAKGGS